MQFRVLQRDVYPFAKASINLCSENLPSA